MHLMIKRGSSVLANRLRQHTVMHTVMHTAYTAYYDVTVLPFDFCVAASDRVVHPGAGLNIYDHTLASRLADCLLSRPAVITLAVRQGSLVQGNIQFVSTQPLGKTHATETNDQVN